MKTDQTCVELCPQGSFGEDSQCKNCAEGCAVCGGLDACTSTAESYFLLNGVPVMECPQSTFGEDSQCKTCAEGCEVCGGLDSCTSTA